MTVAVSSPSNAADFAEDLRRAARTAASPTLVALGGVFAVLVVVVGAPPPFLLLACLPIGLRTLPALVASPRLAVAVMVSLTLANANDVLAAAGLRGVEVATGVLGAVALARAAQRGEVALRWTAVHTVVVLFLLSRAATIVVAQHPQVAAADVLELGRVVLFFLVAATLATAPGGVAAIVGAALATTALLCGLAVLQETIVGNQFEFFGFSRVPKSADRGGLTSRHSGPETDANFWGRTLVLWVPFAAAAALPHLRRSRGIVAAVAGLLLIAGIYLTQSRGALLAAGLAIVLFLAVAGPKYRRLLLIVPVVVAAAMALPGVGSRLATLGQVGAATEGAGEGSLVSRFEVMRQGVTMFLEHPAVGVGAHNFRIVDAAYARRSGLLEAEPMAAHNAYIEMAAEGGVFGLATWLLLLGTPLYLALRTARTCSGAERLSAAAVVGGLGGWGFASLFLHISDLRPLLMLAVIAVVVDARRTVLHAPPRARSEVWRRRVVVTAASTAIVLAAGAAVFVVAVEQRWTATTSAVIRPVRTDGEPSAYDLDVATRPAVGQTIAEVVRLAAGAEAGSEISTRSVPGRAIVEVTAAGATAAEARGRAAQALRTGDATVLRLGRSWSLDGPLRTVVDRSYALDAGAAVPIAVIVGIGLLFEWCWCWVNTRSVRNRPPARTIRPSVEQKG